MNYQFTIRPQAVRHLKSIERWYDERCEGLADRFRLEFEATLERINRLPFSTPLVNQHTRRAEMNVFPYAVLYFVDEPDIFILRVIHTKRHPKRFDVNPHGNGVH
jgi:plasmid stabilization system protein ParE